jgi:hypothetical protein
MLLSARGRHNAELADHRDYDERANGAADDRKNEAINASLASYLTLIFAVNPLLAGPRAQRRHPPPRCPLAMVATISHFFAGA